MEDEIERARGLLKQLRDIVRRTKISERAENFLKLADDNLRHPGPRMLRDVHELSAKEKESIDYGNVFVTTEELCELANVSRTTIRTLVNGDYLPQEHHGLYKISEFLEAWDNYQKRPR
jgi:hypothetical protein